MSAVLKRFRTRREQLSLEQGQVLRTALLQVSADRGWPEDAVGQIVASIDATTASESGWTFVMIGPNENRAVVAWLRKHSKRPMAAMAVWAELFTALRWDTGEIMLTRKELAERVGIDVDNVSRIMTELEEINGISRRRDGRRVRYWMNPRAGTKLSGDARRRAQEAAGQISIFDVIEGGRTDQDPA